MIMWRVQNPHSRMPGRWKQGNGIVFYEMPFPMCCHNIHMHCTRLLLVQLLMLKCLVQFRLVRFSACCKWLKMIYIQVLVVRHKLAPSTTGTTVAKGPDPCGFAPAIERVQINVDPFKLYMFPYSEEASRGQNSPVGDRRHMISIIVS